MDYKKEQKSNLLINTEKSKGSQVVVKKPAVHAEKTKNVNKSASLTANELKEARRQLKEVYGEEMDEAAPLSEEQEAEVQKQNRFKRGKKRKEFVNKNYDLRAEEMLRLEKMKASEKEKQQKSPETYNSLSAENMPLLSYIRDGLKNAGFSAEEKQQVNRLLNTCEIISARMLDHEKISNGQTGIILTRSFDEFKDAIGALGDLIIGFQGKQIDAGKTDAESLDPVLAEIERVRNGVDTCKDNHETLIVTVKRFSFSEMTKVSRFGRLLRTSKQDEQFRKREQEIADLKEKQSQEKNEQHIRKIQEMDQNIAELRKRQKAGEDLSGKISALENERKILIVDHAVKTRAEGEKHYEFIRPNFSFDQKIEGTRIRTDYPFNEEYRIDSEGRVLLSDEKLAESKQKEFDQLNSLKRSDRNRAFEKYVNDCISFGEKLIADKDYTDVDSYLINIDKYFRYASSCTTFQNKRGNNEEFFRKHLTKEQQYKFLIVEKYLSKLFENNMSLVNMENSKKQKDMDIYIYDTLHKEKFDKAGYAGMFNLEKDENGKKITAKERDAVMDRLLTQTSYSRLHLDVKENE